jgi:hypothetical protein
MVLFGILTFVCFFLGVGRATQRLERCRVLADLFKGA